jgi:hypothetical protein
VRPAGGGPGERGGDTLRRRARRLRRPGRAALGLGLLLAACSDGSGPPPVVSVSIAVDAAANALIAEPLTLTATVTKNGRPATGLELTWWAHLELHDGFAWLRTEWRRRLAVTSTDHRGEATVNFVPPLHGFHVVVAAVSQDVTDTLRFLVAPRGDRHGGLEWQSLPPMPVGLLAVPAVRYGDRVHLAGYGAPTTGAADLFHMVHYVFDPATGEWSSVTPPPRLWDYGPVTADVHGGVAAALLDGIHLVLGTDHLVYDSLSDAWEPRAGPPTSAWHGLLEVVDGTAYLVASTGAVWAYDPQQDEWSPRARSPTPPDGAASAVLDGRIYVTGGGEFSSYSFGSWHQAARVVQRYDPALDRWEALDSIPFPRRALAAGVIGREICMFGGAFPLSRGDYTFPDMYCYEPESRDWRLGPSIPDAWVGPNPGGSLAGMSAVEWDGDILVFGGGHYYRAIALVVYGSGRSARLSASPPPLVTAAGYRNRSRTTH